VGGRIESLRGADGLILSLSSLSELKRRQKAERDAAKKAEKLAAQKEKAGGAAGKAGGEKKQAADEEDIDPSKYFENRQAALAEAAAEGVAIYPHKFHTTISVPDFVAKYAHLGKGETLPEEKVAVAGRILLKRAAGAKLTFYSLRGDGVTVQILSDARAYEGQEEFKKIHALLRRGAAPFPPPKSIQSALALHEFQFLRIFESLRFARYALQKFRFFFVVGMSQSISRVRLSFVYHTGDIIGVVGFPAVSSPKGRDTGELSITPSKIVLLCPCLHMLPKNTLTDPEVRFRHRCVIASLVPSLRPLCLRAILQWPGSLC
jgi:hypothetical protein